MGVKRASRFEVVSASVIRANRLTVSRRTKTTQLSKDILDTAPNWPQTADLTLRQCPVTVRRRLSRLFVSHIAHYAARMRIYEAEVIITGILKDAV